MSFLQRAGHPGDRLKACRRQFLDPPEAAVDDALVPANVLQMAAVDVTVRYDDQTENYPELSLNITSPVGLETKSISPQE